MAVQFEVNGLFAIADTINKATVKLQKDAMRKATREAMKQIVLPDMKNMAPEDEGDLIDSLRVRAMKPRGRYERQY